MNKETMKKLDGAGWPAFGLGYGRWARVTRNGCVVAGGAPAPPRRVLPAGNSECT